MITQERNTQQKWPYDKIHARKYFSQGPSPILGGGAHQMVQAEIQKRSDEHSDR